MIAAIYARKSTDQRGVAEDQKSVTRQIENARAYATTKGWTVADEHVYVDDGIGGAEFEKRPGYQRLMHAISRKPPFGVLVMSEDSRLGREGIETTYAIKQIAGAGVRVFTYLDDREVKVGTFEDNLTTFVRGESSSQERRLARQRTYDAMKRKAEAGHVTGGACYGYVNVDVMTGQVDQHGRPKRSHVERRIHPEQAAVVRRIFELSAQGYGHTRIAKLLNDEHAPAPRSQQGRPRSWSPSSVHEALHRELYAGVIVWNRTGKRDTWGKKNQQAKPEADWLRINAPDLAIVPEPLWLTVQARLAEARATYLRDGKGRLYGRPRENDSPYLMTSFMRCAQCGGGVYVKSRAHGAVGKRTGRRFFYGCTSYHKRGSGACENHLEVPLDQIDTAMIDAILADVLTEDMAQAVLQRVLDALQPEQRRGHVAQLRADLRTVEAELLRLTEAIAATGALPAIVDAIKVRQAERDHLAAKVAAAEAVVVDLDLVKLDREARARIRDWRGLLTGNVAQARQILRKLLDGPMQMTPLADQSGVRLTGRANYGKVVQLGWRPRRETPFSVITTNRRCHLGWRPHRDLTFRGIDVFWPSTRPHNGSREPRRPPGPLPEDPRKAPGVGSARGQGTPARGAGRPNRNLEALVP